MKTRLVSTADAPADAIDISRGSRWATPFQDGAGAVGRYRAYIARRDDILGALSEIRGRALVCRDCPPGACHGDVLVEMADDPYADLLG